MILRRILQRNLPRFLQNFLPGLETHNLLESLECFWSLIAYKYNVLDLVGVLEYHEEGVHYDWGVLSRVFRDPASPPKESGGLWILVPWLVSHMETCVCGAKGGMFVWAIISCYRLP